MFFDFLGTIVSALVGACVISHFVLLMGCIMKSTFGDDSFSFSASGHLRAFTFTFTICWLGILLYRVFGQATT